MSLNSAATFPAAIWDGDSGNRDSADDNKRAPDFRDWKRLVAEIRAVQESNSGIDPNTTLNSHGVLATVTGLTVKEYGNAAIHKTVITLDEVDVVTEDGTNASYAAFGTKGLYTFPEGHMLLLGSHQVYPSGGLEATTGGGGGISDTATLEIGVGSTVRTDDADFDLSTDASDQDIVPLHIAAALSSGASAAIETSALTAAVFFDGSAGAIVATLNVISATDDTDHGAADDVLKVSGTITLIWTMQGDN